MMFVRIGETVRRLVVKCVGMNGDLVFFVFQDELKEIGRNNSMKGQPKKLHHVEIHVVAGLLCGQETQEPS